MNRLRLTALLAAAVPAVLLVLLVAAWAVDTMSGGDQVQRNVRVAGHDVGGLDETSLLAELADLNARIGTTPVDIVTPAATLRSTAGALGLDLDEQATAAAALDVGRGRPVVLRPFAWLGSFFGTDDAPTSFVVDRQQVAATVAELESTVRTAPVEPTVAFEDGILVAQPGGPGQGLDPAQIADALARVDEAPRGTLTVEADFVPVTPRFSNADLQAFVGRVNAATADPLPVVLGGEPRELDATALRAFVSAVPGAEGLAVALDAEGVLDLLSSTYADLATEPQDATVSVSGGQVVITPGTEGRVCCEASAVEALTGAIEDGVTPVALQFSVQPPARTADYLAGLGIAEPVASFTTNHPPGQPRVRNIHRMADMVAGSVIAPGETFSLNDTTGPRTTAKGFVAAPIILDATFAEDVGGGVSQFATTLFNAAFFAGLEFHEYMAHGLYISRYPYGREATLSHPSPDLKIHNNTPYGVLVWPSYTDTSITVTMYSTSYVVGEQTGQTVEQYGVACKLVTTERTRTWVGTGETEKDTVSAIYQDQDGVRCDGSRQNPPPEETTTTVPPAPAPAPPADPAAAPPAPAPPAPAG